MLSKSKLKYIRSLKEKKYRDEYGVFVAEGNKLVAELMTNTKCQILVATSAFLHSLDAHKAGEILEVNEKDLSQISFVKNPQQAFGVFYKRAVDNNLDISSQLVIALDGIQDPGNMGTIVRLADWYGIGHIFCSHDTADIYNPKVVQATMGAIARPEVHYVDLPAFLDNHSNLQIYGTHLDGENIYRQELTPNGILVMGNEGKGIRPETEKRITKRLFIPGYPAGHHTSESLNVAVATAIVCAEFRRRSFPLLSD